MNVPGNAEHRHAHQIEDGPVITTSETAAGTSADLSRPRRDRLALLWLALAALLLLVSNGRWTIAAATWLAPVFLVRFIRGRRVVPGLLVGWVTHLVTFIPAWNGLVPLPGVWFLVFAAGMNLILIAPYALDRVASPRIGGFASTLILPAAWTVMEYVTAISSPYGSWGSVAYTQYGNLPLLQLLSVTGLWGVTFLVLWFAAVVNWAWERSFRWSSIRHGVLCQAVVMAVVLLLGGGRLASSARAEGTVRVAGVTARNESELPEATLKALQGEGPLPAATTTAVDRLRDELFRLSAREAEAGARIIFWAEFSCAVRKEEEPEFFELAGRFARQHGVYLITAVGTTRPGDWRWENKTVMFAPSGKVAARHLKSIPVPGEPSIPGDGILRVVETSHGRIATAICFDLDFPQLVRQTGRAGADIVLAPSSDWRAIDPIHTRMATFRAIENGAAVLRQTKRGLSIAVDHAGRVLAEVDYFRSEDHVMVAVVPTRGVTTIYSKVGDVFAWLCLVALTALLGVAVRRNVGYNATVT